MLQRPSTHTPWCTNEIVARVPDPTAIYACACWGKFRNQRKQQQKINNENLCDLLEDWFFGVIAASAQRWTGIDKMKCSEWKSRPLRFCILNVGDETRTYSTSGHRYWYSMVFGQFILFKRIQTAFKSINTDQNCHFLCVWCTMLYGCRHKQNHNLYIITSINGCDYWHYHYYYEY